MPSLFKSVSKDSFQTTTTTTTDLASDQDSFLEPLADPTDPPPSYASTTSTADTVHGLPLWFNVYFQATWRCNLYTLGHAKETPILAASLHLGLSSKPRVVLHSGPTKDDEWLATASGERKWSMYDSVLRLPSSSTDDAGTKMKMKLHRRVQSYIFSVRIPSEKGTQLEEFEWRSSRGPEVRAGNSKRAQGWKLVRLTSPVHGGGKRGQREQGRTSDGHEVVAAWADHLHLTLSKMGRFVFLGAGATGELGAEWTRLAVVSCLRVVQIQCETTAGATGAAGASGAGAVVAATV